MEVNLLTQNFNTLPSTNGASDNATFVSALPGWAFVNSNTVRQVGTGSSNTGAIYSFGAASDPERALGGVASGGTNSQAWGVCITNATTAPYEQITVEYMGEQWRNGGNTTAHALTVSITTSSTFAADLATNLLATSGSDLAAGWVDVPSLTFTGPIATSTGGALDGNADANNTLVSSELVALEVPASGVLCIRWLDANDSGNDHGLAIDDLVIDAMTTG
jgi:hypothetical protein